MMDRSEYFGQVYDVHIASELDGCTLETLIYDPLQVDSHDTDKKDHDKDNDTSRSKRTAVILSHPYGPLGGNMDNNVVEALWEELVASRSVVVVRYNARGVGNSAGRTSWTGASEWEDGKSVIRHVLQTKQLSQPIDRVVLCGYSYGAMTLCACASAFPGQVAALIAISYPLRVAWLLSFFRQSQFYQNAFRRTPDATVNTSPSPIPAPPIPTLFLHGRNDNFTSVEALESFVESSVDAPKLVVVLEKGDHFWMHQEQDVAVNVVEFLKSIGVLPILESPPVGLLQTQQVGEANDRLGTGREEAVLLP